MQGQGPEASGQFSFLNRQTQQRDSACQPQQAPAASVFPAQIPNPCCWTRFSPAGTRLEEPRGGRTRIKAQTSEGRPSLWALGRAGSSPASCSQPHQVTAAPTLSISLMMAFVPDTGPPKASHSAVLQGETWGRPPVSLDDEEARLSSSITGSVWGTWRLLAPQLE